MSERNRAELLRLMSAWSEDRYCAGWLNGLESILHQPGSMWEAISRNYGGIWPQDAYPLDGGPPVWTTWDEFDPERVQ